MVDATCHDVIDMFETNSMVFLIIFVWKPISMQDLMYFDAIDARRYILVMKKCK